MALGAAVLLEGLFGAGPAAASGRLATWQVGASLQCNSSSFCGDGLGGLIGQEVFYSDGTASAELTQTGHLIAGGAAAGAQHLSAEADGWFVAPSSANPAVNDFWISSEVATFTGGIGTPPLTAANPFPPYPEDTGIPAAPGHYDTTSFMGFGAPPGVSFQVEVVKLPTS
jgi:hypothetical protein